MHKDPKKVKSAGDSFAEGDSSVRRLTADDILLQHQQQSPSKAPQLLCSASPKLHITNFTPRGSTFPAGDPQSGPVALSLSGNALRSLQQNANRQLPFGLDYSSLKSAGLVPSQMLLQSSTSGMQGNQLTAVRKQGTSLKQLSPALSRQSSASNQSADLLSRLGSVRSQQCDMQGLAGSQRLQRQTSASPQHMPPLNRQGSASIQRSVTLPRHLSPASQDIGPVVVSRSLQHASSQPQPDSSSSQRKLFLLRQASATLPGLMHEQLTGTSAAPSQRSATASRQSFRSTSLSCAAAAATTDLLKGASSPPSLADLQLDGTSIRTPSKQCSFSSPQSCEFSHKCIAALCLQ